MARSTANRCCTCKRHRHTFNYMMCLQKTTRHRASISMYLLTFCVRVMFPERQQWKTAVQATAVMLRTPPSTAGHRPAAREHPAERSHYVVISRDGRKLVIRVALCCHSNATRALIANPPNNAQLGGSLYHAPKLHPGPCGSVGVWPQTDTQTRVTTIHFASSTTDAKCNKDQVTEADHW